MNYGFLIDQRKCIGCHACTTACKSENEVPLGVNRTWVKYVEKGAFPDVRRSFQVTRCNHCANPPCVRICPVTAMYQRTDGIVEFDPRVCIGCKACMQACPYDAIYIDPETNTAAKCHYCSHRVEVGLEPACVVVCPEHAIVAGDLNNPHSEISQLILHEPVSVRKPEQGTSPKLFYIDADEVTLTPTAAPFGETFVWADRITEQEIPVFGPVTRAPVASATAGVGGNGHNGSAALAVRTPAAFSGVPIRTPSAQGVPHGGLHGSGPIVFGEGRMADHMVQATYNAQHHVPWHWPVPAYLVTKSIGSGIFMLLALLFGLGASPFSRPLALAANFAALVSIGLTTLLLVMDLEKPERFFTILTRPQWKSWLARGAFILIGFSLVAGLWLLVEGGVQLGLLPERLADLTRPVFLWAGLPLAVLAAVYTAFLFGQAEGRDLWQSSLLPVHLLVQALLVGSAALLALGFVFEMPASLGVTLAWIFGAALVVDLLVTLLGEFGMPHASELAARAAHQIREGKYRLHFWGGSIMVGHILPLAALLLGVWAGGLSMWLALTAALAAVLGLFWYEYAFVMAPQELPNS